MKRLILLGLALLALGFAVPGSAYAQATRTWVSGVGDDANPCSRTAPCKTWAGAISKTSAGGEIDALDPGGFGTVTITKSITLDGGSGIVASVLAAGTNGIVVAAGLTDVVIIRNLDLQGLLGNASSPGSAGINGIRFLTGATLIVENCKIFGFNTWGIDFEPSATSALSVINTSLENNGLGNTSTVGGGAILVAPNGGTGEAAVTGTTAANNLIGLKALGDNTTNKLNVVVNNSQAIGSSKAGFSAESGNGSSNGPVAMILNGVLSSGNNVGVGASGSNVNIIFGNSTITENNTGVSSLNSAVVGSYKNNQINQNGTDGTPITQVGLN